MTKTSVFGIETDGQGLHNPSVSMNWQGKRILIVGDVMLDKYIFGEVERIWPEAPAPIVSVRKESFVPGGAANAASNVAAMEGCALLVGIVGNDIAKDILIKELQKRDIDVRGLVTDSAKPTIQKIRVLGQSQQLLRIDYEDSASANGAVAKQLIDAIAKWERLDCIIVSDYAKGTITEGLLKVLKDMAKSRKIPLIIDPKPQHKSWYRGCALITPNRKEAEEMAGIKLNTLEEVEQAGKKLAEELDCHVLLTRGEKGISLFEKGKQGVHIPTVAKEVYDVSGAGDTVIATLALALSSGIALRQAAVLANQAAGIKVGKIGTAPVSLKELQHESHLL